MLSKGPRRSIERLIVRAYLQSHARVSCVHMSVGHGMKFECVYPWGQSYSNQPTAFLDECGILWCEDTRTDGGDSYGFLVSKNEPALRVLVAELPEIMTQIDAEEGDEAELWDKAWNMSSEEVIELSTD